MRHVFYFLHTQTASACTLHARLCITCKYVQDAIRFDCCTCKTHLFQDGVPSYSAALPDSPMTQLLEGCGTGSVPALCAAGKFICVFLGDKLRNAYPTHVRQSSFCIEKRASLVSTTAAAPIGTDAVSRVAYYKVGKTIVQHL